MKKILLLLLLIMGFVATAVCQEVMTDATSSVSIYDLIANWLNSTINISTAVFTAIMLLYSILEFILGKTNLVKSNSVLELVAKFFIGIFGAIIKKGKLQTPIVSNPDTNPIKGGKV